MKKCVFYLLLLSLLLFAGCGERLPEYTLEVPTTESPTEESIVETTRRKEWRDYATYPVESPFDHVVGNVYWYTNSPVIHYYDVDLRRTVYLCSQPNCAHHSENCTAFLGGDYETIYQVVGDMAYALVVNTDKEESALFLERNLITGEDRILWDLTPEENVIQEYFQLSIDGNTAFLSFQQYNWKHEIGFSTVTISNKLSLAYAIDLTTGERELLLQDALPIHEQVEINGDELVVEVCTENFLLIQDVDHSQMRIVSQEEYFKENPQASFEEYEDYLRTIAGMTGDHYSVNRKTGERKRICGNVREANLVHDGFRDKKMVFVDGTTVCIYDGRTGEVTPCFEQENTALLILMDGRVIYNIFPEDEGNGIYTYFWYDLTTGETHQFQEGVSNMIFSIHGETTDHFLGIYNGRSNCFISKQDFYNENYDAAF